MDPNLAQKGTRTLISLLDTLSALRAQLEDNPDVEEKQKLKGYGQMVPIQVAPAGTPDSVIAEMKRLWGGVRESQARSLEGTMSIIRDLLGELSQSEALRIDDLK